MDAQLSPEQNVLLKTDMFQVSEFSICSLTPDSVLIPKA